MLDALDMLLRDAVESGASVGFLPPLAPEEARAFWQGTLDEVAAGTRLALGAWLDERLVGTVHLALATKPNGRHRGEVQKLLVHTTARRRGIAQKLLDAIERAALESGRTLLVLDTEQGSDAERLYRRVGIYRGRRDTAFRGHDGWPADRHGHLLQGAGQCVAAFR